MLSKEHPTFGLSKIEGLANGKGALIFFFFSFFCRRSWDPLDQREGRNGRREVERLILILLAGIVPAWGCLHLYPS